MTRSIRQPGFATSIAGAATAILLVACGGSEAGTSPSPAAVPTEAATAQATESTAATEAAAMGPEVNVARDATLGDFLTGEDGRTLYLFTVDSPGTSACTDQCAANWPPFTVEAGETPDAGDGVTGTFGTLTRTDGSLQVTYNDVPLYYFAADKAAGETNGQGVNDVWFIVKPDGTPGGASTGSGDYAY